MAMVFCRGCGKEIHETAPACPHCGALQGISSHSNQAIPDGINGWSWGAFFLSWIWAIGNRTWIGLLALIPFVGFVISIILGIKGREWAWKNNKWESVEHFNRVQYKWSLWGWLIIVGIFLIGILGAIAIPSYQAYIQKAKSSETAQENQIPEQNQEVTDALPKESDVDKCVSAKIKEFRKANGEDALIMADVSDEWEAECKGGDTSKDILSFEGKHPTAVLDDQTFHPLFQSLTGNLYKDFSYRLQVGSEIKVDGDWLVGEGIAAHSGGSDEAAYAINLNSKAIFALMLVDGAQFTCFGVDNCIHLPPPLLKWYTDHGGQL